MRVAAPWVAVTRIMVHLVATQAHMMVEWRGICSLKVLEVVFLLMAHLAIAQLDMDMVLPIKLLYFVQFEGTKLHSETFVLRKGIFFPIQRQDSHRFQLF